MEIMVQKSVAASKVNVKPTLLSPRHEQTINVKHTFELKNRRYLGNKHKLLPFIKNTIRENCGKIDSFCDLFAGTGSVGQAFNDENTRILSNDYLVSNYVSLSTFLRADRTLEDSIGVDIDHLNSLPAHKNYFSVRYGGTFYTQHNAKKIGVIREEIDKIAPSGLRKSVLLTSLMYAMDKAANTVGHYDAYRKVMDCRKPLTLKAPHLEDPDINRGNIVMNRDANVAIRKEFSDVDVLYLDPPYNSRQYCDAYHLLENTMMWTKPDTFGKAQKMDRSGIKSRYCCKNAAEAFEDLILAANANHIFLSYNSTCESRDGRSNSKMNDDEILRILKAKGKTSVFETPYMEFTTGKTASDPSHVERLFHCRVRR